MLGNTRLSLAVAICLTVGASHAQEKKPVPPPPKPVDDGPKLELTMKFIQDKLNDQDTVGYLYTRSNGSGVLFRHHYLLSDVIADASTCTLRVKEKDAVQIEVADGVTYQEGGKWVTGDELQRELFTTSTSLFKQVVSIEVDSADDFWNRRTAESAHGDITFTFTPAVYNVTLNGTKQDAFSVHITATNGRRSPQNSEPRSKQKTFIFRDEETANRVAKAMVHAVELCGGGNKEPF
jgi:hypothetical protein